MCGFDNEELKAKIAALSAEYRKPSKSPFGPEDEIGMLNLITPESRQAVMTEADASKCLDLSVQYFTGMPSWVASGDPSFQIWMSHTPSGTVVDDPLELGREHNELVSYSGDCISMYTHCGTHIDTFNHYGYHGELFNGFKEADHLGSRHWTVAGAEKFPPIISRGILIDVAAAQGVDVLPNSFGIGEQELREALDRQGTKIRPGDVVLIRTGRMTVWPDMDLYLTDEPGLNREGAEFLAKAGAIIVGGDNIALEQFPSPDPENWVPVHTYLLAEAGVPVMEVVNTEPLAAEGVHEFAFIGACLPLRGATAAPMRPMALPLRS
jgi:kynurenine formamidase